MNVRCFMIVELPNTKRIISRISKSTLCVTGKRHAAEKQLADGLLADKESSYHEFSEPYRFGIQEYPAKCDHCDYEFTENDLYSFNVLRMWVRADNGEFVCNQVHKAPVGAMWNAHWLTDMKDYCGSDGNCLSVMTPGGEWVIDSRASNCGSLCTKCSRPYREHKKEDTCNQYTYEDSNPVHKCWVRHGIPPIITVDKAGVTCDAGAGSIQCGDYHGFLRNGELTDCP